MKKLYAYSLNPSIYLTMLALFHQREGYKYKHFYYFGYRSVLFKPISFIDSCF